MSDPTVWAGWVRRLGGIATLGSHYASDPYDTARYAELGGIVHEMSAALTGVPADGVLDPYRDDSGHVTPKVDVRALVRNDAGAVLLVREVADGRWTLPGGWLDVGESPATGAVREVSEESGYDVVVRGLVGAYDEASWTDPPTLASTVKLVLACAVVGGAPRGSAETSEVGWFDSGALPELSPQRTPPRLLDHLLRLGPVPPVAEVD